MNSNFPQEQRLNPFPGLRPFQSDEDYLFFGREDQVGELLDLLRSHQLVAVVGTSGSGKSSLVRCGLLSELQGGMMLAAGSRWEIAVMQPGGDPLANLAQALIDTELYDEEDEENFHRILATINRSTHGLVEAVKQSEIDANSNLLIVVDQFEEIFRFHQASEHGAEQAPDFIRRLLHAVDQQDVPIYVVLTMRSDFLGDCARFTGLAETINTGEYLVPKLTREQLRQAIEGPARVAGGSVSRRLIQRLLNDVGEQSDQLPVLQHALMRSWEHCVARSQTTDTEVDLEDYESVGTMANALSNHADEVLAELERQETSAIRETVGRLFKALTEKGDDNRGVRRPTRLSELASITEAPVETATAIIDAYRAPGRTFLMPSAGTPLDSDTVIDISHESLMRVWQRLRHWVTDEAQSVRIYRRLSDTASLWSQGEAGLYRNPDLQIAMDWVEAEQPNAAWGARFDGDYDVALSFLEQSSEAKQAAETAAESARQRELEQAQALAAAETQRATLQQRAARRMRYLSAGAATIAVAALVAFVFAFSAQREASRQEASAKENAQKALDAQQVAQQNETKAKASQQVAQQNATKARSAALETEKQANAARAAEKQAQENAVAAQRSAAEAVRQQKIAQDAQGEAETAATTLNATLTQSYFVTANEKLETDKVDQTLAYLARSLRTDPTYWQAAAEIVLLLSERSFPLEDARSIAMDEPIRKWGLDEDKNLVWTLNQSYQGVLWDANASKSIGKLADGQQIDWPEFTADGKRLYVSLREQGGSIVGLSTETGEIVTPVITVQNRMNRPYIVGSRVDGQVRVLLDDPQSRQLLLWDGESGAQIALHGGAKAPLQQRHYGLSRNHRYVYAAYVDKTVSVWNSGDGSPVVAAGQHGMAVSQIGMTPDSKWIVMASQVEGAMAWMPVGGAQTNPQKIDIGFPVGELLFHPQEPLAIVVGRAAEQGFAKVVNLETAKVVTSITQDKLTNPRSMLNDSVVYLGRKDDSQVLSRWLIGMVSHGGRQLGVWDLGSGKEIQRFFFEDSATFDAGFTADGGRVYSSHEDNKLRIWDLFSGEPLADPIEHPWLPFVTPTADGEKLITTNVGDRAVRVFSSRTGKLLIEPQSNLYHGLPEGFTQLNDRNQIINAEITNATILGVTKRTRGLLARWSSRPRAARVLPFRLNGAVNGRFSPDGKQLLLHSNGNRSDGNDSMAKIWDLESGRLVHSLRHISGVNGAWFSPDGKRLVTGSSDEVMRIWDLETGRVQLEFDAVTPLTGDFNAQGNRIVLTTAQGAVGVWDVESGFPVYGPSPVSGWGDFMPDGRRVLVTGRDGVLRLIDTDTGDVKTLPDRHNGFIGGTQMSPKGTHFVTSSFMDSTRVWDIATGKSIWKTETPAPYLACAFHPDGELIAVCHAGYQNWQLGQVEVWNWRTGKRAVESFQCEGQIFGSALQFSPDGRFLAGGTVNGLLSLWDVSTGKRILRVKQYARQIDQVQFAPDGRLLLTASRDGTAKIIVLPPVHDAIPGWFAELAESVGGKRISENGAVETVDGTNLEAIQQQIAAAPQENGYTQWARWYLTDPMERPAAPFVNVSMHDYLDVRSRGQSLEEQYDAFSFDPNNGLISCRIGYLLATSASRQGLKPQARTHWDAMALWYGVQGTQLSGDIGETWALRAAIQQIVGKPAGQAIARALERDAESPIAWFVQAFQLESEGKSAEAYRAFSKSVALLPENRYSLDWNNEKPFLIGTLRKILDQEKRNPLTLASSGQGRLLEATDTVERRRLEAEWLTRLATELGPDDSEVWRLRGQVLASLGRHDEAFQSLKKSADLDAQGRPDWHQLGQLVRAYSEQLIDLKQDQGADDYLLKYGIPPRDAAVSADQIDLTKFYNHSLFEQAYRVQGKKSNDGSLWHRLPIGLSRFNGVAFDVRGMIRLSGGTVAGSTFSRPLPAAVKEIEVQRRADWLHFLHNVKVADFIPVGDEVGYYQLHYVDGETRRLPIRYGHDVAAWLGNEFELPTQGALAWNEGRYQRHKTLYHSTWENPRPQVAIATVDFVSTNSMAAPFLVAISLESDREDTDSDPQRSSQRALHRVVYAQGQTELTHNAAERASLRALEAAPADDEVAYRRAEVLLATGKLNDASTLVKRLRTEQPDHPGYRLLQGRVAWRTGQRETAAQTLTLPAGNVAARVLLKDTDRVLLKRLHRLVLNELGPEKGRAFVVATQVASRDPELPPEVIDLTRYYNASLGESWYTRNNSRGPGSDLFRTLRPGPRVIQGVQFDIRGVVQLNDRKENVMQLLFPSKVEGIEVAVAGDQIHFLHAAFNQGKNNAPAALYRIHLENGKTLEYIARWERDVSSPRAERNRVANTNVAWRAEGVTGRRGASDAVLHLSTWTNPTPDSRIERVDFVVGGAEPQPFLVAMTVESFAQQLASDPGEARRLSALAVQKAEMKSDRSEQLLDYAAKLIAKAVGAAPNDTLVQRRAAQVALRLGDPQQALASIDRALELDGTSSLNWQTRGRILGNLKRFSEARQAKVETRAAQLQELVPARAESTAKHLIDLTQHYNIGLSENPFETLRKKRDLTETFAGIPPGASLFGGIKFDVRGIVALHGKQSQLRPMRAAFRERVAGIQVGQAATTLYFLHGAAWADNMPHGTVIGTVVVRYEDGETAEIPIRSGVHVRDWFLLQQGRRQVSDGELVWMRPSLEVDERDIGIYLMKWENPRSDQVIQSLDYESTMTDASPFLLGVTVEENPAGGE
jgi:WD40 repeat protein/Flp pilus assembly protein TadD/energy-coupling factor transporter ATP-binding protein EcfA2